jgi:L-ribulose-5-phosphate 3-epimerase
MITGRRNFIKTISGAAVTLPLALRSLISAGPGKNNLRLFSKPLDGYDFDFMCECVAKAGIGGIDLTVRQGGRVEPSRVATDLQFYVDKARKYGLIIDMIVTGIVSAKDKYAETIIKTASECGVKYYRMGWIEYDLTRPVKANLDDCKKSFAGLAELNKRYKINGGYQNHEGSYIGSAVWDLYDILKDLPCEYIGSQYDVRHAVVEGHNSWEAGMRIIAPYISTVAIKDFTWSNTEKGPTAVTVPLGEGIVDWKKYFSVLKEIRFSGPVSLHIEYQLLDTKEECLSYADKQKIIVRKLSKDADHFVSWLV